MTLEQRIVAALAQAAMLTCVIGLLRTGRWRMAPTFAAYAVLVVLMEPLQTWWPSRFHAWWYWNLKQTIYDAVKLVMAVELAARICQDFPGAKAITRRWLLGVLLLTALGLVVRPWQADFLLVMTGELHARAVTGTLWLLVATFFVVRHYRLIVHPFHLGLLVGFGVYLAVWGALLRLMLVSGGAIYELSNWISPPVYVAFASWLAWVAWRPARDATEHYNAVVDLLRARTA